MLFSTLLAPEQLDQLFSSEKINKNMINNEKSEIFTIALLLTHLGALENKERPYNLSAKSINFDGLQRKLSFMRSLYSNNLCELLISMLSIDPLSRPGFSDILSIIHDNKHDNKKYNTPPNKKQMSSAKKNRARF